jgi:hypothetical protein
MNDTPRTDAEEYDVWEGADYAVNVVPSSFARALERELADAVADGLRWKRERDAILPARQRCEAFVETMEAR